jgi:hypothetical protein
VISTDAERWNARVLALTTVVGVDALAVLLPVQERLVTFAAGGVAGDEALAAVAAPIGAALRGPVAIADTDVPLVDGRRARELLAVPIKLAERPLGILVALNERHKFGEVHATRVASAADVLAVELATSNALFHAERSERALLKRLAQAEADRAQALLLYELGRLDPAGERALDLAAAMLADTGGHSSVGIWACAPNTWLELRGSRGHPAADGRQVLGDADSGPAAAIRSRAARTASFAAGSLRPAWAPEPATQFALAPIRDDTRDAGVLVVGRDGPPYAEGELEFASLVALALLPFLAAPGPPAPSAPAAAPLFADLPLTLPPLEPPAPERASRLAVAAGILSALVAQALLADAVLATLGPDAATAVPALGWSAYGLAVALLAGGLALVRLPGSAGVARALFALTLVAFVARGFAVLLEPGAPLLVVGLRAGEAAGALAAAVLLTGRLRAASARAG